MDSSVPAPNILINPEGIGISTAKRKFNLKFLYIILAAVVILLFAAGVWSLLRKDSSGSTPSSKAESLKETSVSNQANQEDLEFVPNGKIILESPKTEVKVGEAVPVTIRIDTGGQIADGVDVVLKFDNKILDAVNSSITTGTLFPDYPVSKVEKDGKVRITAITALQGEGFSGEGIFAVVNFKAKAPGKVLVKVEFTKGSTIDTNIVGTEVADDMLGEVKNLEVIVK